MIEINNKNALPNHYLFLFSTIAISDFRNVGIPLLFSWGTIKLKRRMLWFNIKSSCVCVCVSILYT